MVKNDGERWRNEEEMRRRRRKKEREKVVKRVGWQPILRPPESLTGKLTYESSLENLMGSFTAARLAVKLLSQA